MKTEYRGKAKEICHEKNCSFWKLGREAPGMARIRRG
jgi:hypothetical protein